jgi:hypothetical protein
MKRVLILPIILLLASKTEAQKNTVVSTDSLSYEMTQNLEYTNKLKDLTQFKVYLGKDGQIIKVGDKLKIGAPSGNKVNLVSNSGTISGVRNSTGNANYASEQVGKYMFLQYKVLNSAFFTPETTGSNVLNEEDIVRNIYVLHTGNKKNSLVIVGIAMENPNMKKTLGANIRYITDYDRAIESGEIIGFGKKIVNKQQAIARLKELKELLDLGVITKEDYEKEKAELSKIILKEN